MGLKYMRRASPEDPGSRSGAGPNILQPQRRWRLEKSTAEQTATAILQHCKHRRYPRPWCAWKVRHQSPASDATFWLNPNGFEKFRFR